MFDRGFEIGKNLLAIVLNLALGILLSILGLAAGIVFKVCVEAGRRADFLIGMFVMALILWPTWNYGVVNCLSKYVVTDITYLQAYCLIWAIVILTYPIRPHAPVKVGEILTKDERTLLNIFRGGPSGPATRGFDSLAADILGAGRRDCSGPPRQTSAAGNNPKSSQTGRPEQPVS